MNGGFFSLWQRLLCDLGLQPKARRVSSLDEFLLQSVQELAERERRPEADVASDLLAFALAQRDADESWLELWDMLTAREQQVAALVCLGFTNLEIARRLLISAETVKTHVRSILRKFGLHSKVDLQRALDGWDFSAWIRSE
jgi:DNA-binding NarL/FixJ family response regulator